MTTSNAILRYKQQAVSTMSRGEQLIALYREALKNLRYGSQMMKDKNYPVAEKCTQKSKDIFNYLSSVLNRQYDVSKDLYELYSFINRQIISAEVRRDSVPLDEVIPLVESLTDTWLQAEKLSHMNK